MMEIVKAFAHVFAMMAPWLVFGFLVAGIIAVWIPRSWVNRAMGAAAGHSLSPVHWGTALFLAAMTIYNLARPLHMAHRHRGDRDHDNKA